MELLKTLGFDPIMLGAQIINFLIIFYLLKRFLYKPVLDVLKKRKDEISEGLKQTEEARLTLEKTLENEKKIITNAQNEAKKIMEDAKDQAIDLSKQIEQNSKHQAEKMIYEANTRIEMESKEMEKRLMLSVTKIASEMLSKSLQKTLGAKEQKQIISKTLKEINLTN